MSKDDVRRRFRESVFERDNYTCVVCGRRWSSVDMDLSLGRMNAHHIVDRHEFPDGGYVAENGVTVCDGAAGSCHMQREEFHISGGTRWSHRFHPEDLYRLIGSSLEDALVAYDLIKQ